MSDLNQHTACPNVLHNEEVTAILEEARDKIAALGLQCLVWPSQIFPDSTTSVALSVSSEEAAIDEVIVASRIASSMALRSETMRGLFAQEMAEYRAGWAIFKAMYEDMPGLARG